MLKSLLSFSKNKSDAQLKKSLKTLLGFTPSNISLYKQAFLHSSKRETVNNERLEFLGDAVLGAVIAEHLFKLFPYKDEGFLTQLRSKIVNGQNLQQLALKLGIDSYLKVGLKENEKSKSSVYGDAFEALIGAVYIDKGFVKCKNFILKRIIKIHVDIDELMNTDSDFKSMLQIYCQKNKFTLEYRLLSEEQKGKTKIFTVQVFIDDKPYVTFENYSKRVAEQKAAQLTLEELNIN
ncbi:MAG: ribonuclease III [Sphingobacteriaceae bacterium]|nr:ribonuclease III [Sphingobacteriaceae bacterium]